MSQDIPSLWEQYPSDLDGVDVHCDQNGPGSNFYDLTVPHLTMIEGAWRQNYWRQHRAVISFNDMEQPTLDDLRGYIKVYEKEFGHTPASILLVRYVASTHPDLVLQWGVAVQGPHDPRTYDWPACEWCGADGQYHAQPCPSPSMRVTKDGTPMWSLPVLAGERDRLISLLTQQREPWAKELVRRLKAPRPHLPRNQS